MKKPVKQEHALGCAVACVAFILDLSYLKALLMFNNGETRVKRVANFYCPEITNILNNHNKKYSWTKITPANIDLVYKNFSIVFIKRSKVYHYGHFLVRYKKKWMDPWINLPDKNIKAGLRSNLPNIPTYIIFPV